MPAAPRRSLLHSVQKHRSRATDPNSTGSSRQVPGPAAPVAAIGSNGGGGGGGGGGGSLLPGIEGCGGGCGYTCGHNDPSHGSYSGGGGGGGGGCRRGASVYDSDDFEFIQKGRGADEVSFDCTARHMPQACLYAWVLPCMHDRTYTRGRVRRSR